MSDRSMSVAMLAQVDAAANQPIHLMQLAFDSGTVYATDAARAVVFDGHTYTALGHFLTFSGGEETADLKVPQVSVQLSGVDQTLISAALVEDYTDRRLIIYKGMLDPASADALIVDPIPIHDLHMDEVVIDEDPDGGTCVITVTASGAWADFERRPGRHTNNIEQQLYFPGDKFFEFVSEQNRSITWGAVSAPVPQ